MNSQKEVGHTPGPWVIRELENINICGKLPGQGSQSVGRLQVATVTRLRGEESFNAALIAAAPELLSVAKQALELIRAVADKSKAGNMEKLLERAIAKAEGK